MQRFVKQGKLIKIFCAISQVGCKNYFWKKLVFSGI
ncbi:MAG TPA: hypothetical protein DE316_01715 [Eubacterium sp.]|nr:hypothetical protein [Eubacterium sp.]